MSLFETQLNALLVRAYRSIELIEEQQLSGLQKMNLTIAEIHLLEAVGTVRECPEGKTISEISECLGVSLPSVTLAINKLVKKGFVEKRKSQTDGRVVHVLLTKLGYKANRAHEYFHRKMVSSISSGLNNEEKQTLLQGMSKLNAFLDHSLDKKSFGSKRTSEAKL